MRTIKLLACLLVFLGLAACNNESVSIRAIKIANSGFESGADDWTGGIAEYTTAITATDTILQLNRDLLPTGLDTTNYALLVTSKNRDANMFTYLVKPVAGLKPNTTYNVTFEIGLGTNYPQNISAGSAVYLKAGAAPFEPKKDSLTNAFNLDKGTGDKDGKQMVSIGNVSNELNRAGYALVERNNRDKPVQVVASSNGLIWLCVGIQSGYKGTSILYFENINVNIAQN
jgi:hypothetical protein